MSITHIRHELSELEANLRIEIGAIPSFLEAIGKHYASLSLTELIDKLAQTPLAEHPLFSQLNKLDAAFCQLDLGLYGLCSDCEAEIETVRLTQDPTEQRCNACADHYQHEHRHELRLNH
ncbi:TraR/DksA C4-type zinc finger protein [Shewanella glacialipiscicola]|uniref:Conjugal transfer protein TraR n=1 Tax=Shewanella glacialipiscicola TaxID=614069 RepID=A0ABQ6J8R2_9GAMM|nr:TraR/DksA C4-type zinc finger protein [Shewanella glacialipiscicola]MCL1087788.1 TraR/DksA C4-type zinc finger protein [Shewanella glacialipiscicola]MCU7995751.1 TraR/DksA C4-type zinc finger protein [Shewanella glacialipiscicola]MCU8026998.1 TraR/DksA C4-type zinc finger protein [Shewanella glacialipiscicola]GIU06567.1 conjugal transfer protein TraR [Shewanella glacialipiscicola]GMA81681.1 conjugal transfer protein TraR [Shewanella glacialipiscicola]